MSDTQGDLTTSLPGYTLSDMPKRKSRRDQYDRELIDKWHREAEYLVRLWEAILFDDRDLELLTEREFNDED